MTHFVATIHITIDILVLQQRIPNLCTWNEDVAYTLSSVNHQKTCGVTTACAHHSERVIYLAKKVLLLRSLFFFE